MKITWNGTGSAWSYQFGNASALIEAEGKRLLIDCGHTVPGRLQQMGYSLRDIDAVYVTHLHGDHIYGLEEWGFRNLLVWKNRSRLFLHEELAQPLWRHILSGSMSPSCKGDCNLKDYFDVTLMETKKTYAFGSFTLEIHPVRHVPNAPAFGIKVRTRQAAVAFTGDSLADCDPWLYQDTEAVFHDCNFSSYYEETVHAHFEQLLDYPEAYRAKTYLVHYDDNMAVKFADTQWRTMLSETKLRLANPFEPMHFPARP
jgi:ribonuclease BN (tRNA processing enzyme)